MGARDTERGRVEGESECLLVAGSFGNYEAGTLSEPAEVSVLIISLPDQK